MLKPRIELIGIEIFGDGAENDGEVFEGAEEDEPVEREGSGEGNRERSEVRA